jgi:hypothetical protein
VLVAACGAILLLEMTYRRATQLEAGAKMRLFGVELDTSTPWPWLAAIASLAFGAFALRLSVRGVRDAWQRALEEAKSAPSRGVRS